MMLLRYRLESEMSKAISPWIIVIAKWLISRFQDYLIRSSDVRHNRGNIKTLNESDLVAFLYK